MTLVELFRFLLILLAPAVGAFLAVIVDRLPRGEDIVLRRSHCRSCNRQLAPWDLIPLASFLALRGRCRTCAAPIPPFKFYVEILALGAAILAVLAGGSVFEITISVIWLWLLIALAVSDLIWFRLPDALTFLLAVSAFSMIWLPDGIGFSNAIVGAVLGAGSFAVLRWVYARLRHREGLGMGDVKLIFGLGAYAGPLDLPVIILVAALLAIALALITRPRGDPIGATLALPFGASLCVAGALLWFFRAAS